MTTSDDKLEVIWRLVCNCAHLKATTYPNCLNVNLSANKSNKATRHNALEHAESCLIGSAQFWYPRHFKSRRFSKVFDVKSELLFHNPIGKREKSRYRISCLKCSVILVRSQCQWWENGKFYYRYTLHILKRRLNFIFLAKKQIIFEVSGASFSQHTSQHSVLSCTQWWVVLPKRCCAVFCAGLITLMLGMHLLK